jgi:predicted peptidase
VEKQKETHLIPAVVSMCLVLMLIAGGCEKAVNNSNSSSAVTTKQLGSFTLVAEPQDYGLTVTRLLVDLGDGAAVTKKDLNNGDFEVTGSNMADKGPRKVTGLSVVDKDGKDADTGRYVAVELEYGYDYAHSSKENGLSTQTGKNGSRIAESGNDYSYEVTLSKDLGKYSKGTKFIQAGKPVKNLIDDIEKVTANYDAKAQGGIAGFDYRFWIPKSVTAADKATSALYVWVDSDAQQGIYKYGTSFAITDEIQNYFKGSAFVLLPCHNQNYTNLAPGASDNRPVYKAFAKDIILLINKLLAENPAIDPSRVVIGGSASLGSGVTLEALIQAPNLFAAGFPVSSGFSLTDEEIDILKEKPIWFVTASNDTGYKGSTAAYQQLFAVNAPVLQTVNPYVVLNNDQYYNPHWSWVMVHRNKVFAKLADRTLNLFGWLAAQRTDFLGRGPTHKDKNNELLKLYDAYTFKSFDERIGDMEYYLYDPIAHGADAGKTYPLIVVFHGANNGKAGVRCASDTDCAVYGGQEYQAILGGAYVLFPKANEDSGPGGRAVGTWSVRDPNTGTSIYIPTSAAIIEKVIKENKIDKNHVVIGGTSAGGYMAWRFMAARPDLVKAAFLMAPANNPSDEELKMYDDMNLPIWIIHGKKDELCSFSRFTGPLMDKFKAMKNVRVSALETVRFGDRGIVTVANMGQHLALFCVGANMIYDDGTPYDVRYPDGFTGWLKSIWK